MNNNVQQKNFFPRSILVKVSLVFIILVIKSTVSFPTPASTTKEKGEFTLFQSKDCGITTEVGNDIRTKLPWIVGIHFRHSSIAGGYKYYTTGAIVSNTTVISIVGGVFGAFPYGTNSKYIISPPRNYVIVAGINSTNLRDIDSHSQVSEVSYILPYTGHVKSNKQYHYVLYRLKTPLNFSTPYVKPICLPLLLSSNYTLNYSPHKWRFYQAGYGVRESQSNNSDILNTSIGNLKMFDINTGTKDECNSIFRYYYKGSGSGDAGHTFCGRRSVKDSEEADICHLHGSTAYFVLLNRAFLSGQVSLIPGRKRGMCDRNTTYIYSEEILYARGKKTIDWIVRNTKCDQFHYPCSNGTCIPISSVCNLIGDCQDSSDENPIYCDAINYCNSTERFHQCGIGGKCISKEAICNGKSDCPDGSDESNEACSELPGNEQFLLGFQSINSRKCPKLIITSGTIATCYSPFTKDIISCDSEVEAGSTANLTCDKFTTSLHSIEDVILECNDKGKWIPNIPFTCETKCGEVKSLPDSPTNYHRLPWHAGIYLLEENSYVLKCSGTLIEPMFLLSAGSCFENFPIQNAKIVVSPISMDFKTNSKDHTIQVYNLAHIWKSPDSKLALLKLEKSVKLGGYIRPICYFTTVTSAGIEQPETPAKFAKTIDFNTESKSTKLETLILDESCESPEAYCISTSNLCQAKENIGTGLNLLHIGFGDVTKYTLEGILINADSTSCTKNYFLKLGNYEDWIIKILESNS